MSTRSGSGADSAPSPTWRGRRPTARHVAVALLVADALLVLSPALAVAQAWLGAWLVGAGAVRVRLPDVVAQGLGILAGPALVLALLLAARGVAGGSRRWAWAGLVLQSAVLAVVVVPFLRPMSTLARLPGGWVLTALLALATAAALVAVLARGGGGRRRRPDRSVPLGVALGATGVLIAGAVVGAASPALPGYPWDALLGAGRGDGTGLAVPADRVPQNPALAANPFNSLHGNAWATDSYDQRGPVDPRTAAVDSLFLGGDCATIAFDSRGRLVTVCSSLREVYAYVVDPATLSVLARERIAGRTGSVTDFAGGGYFFLDRRDRLVVATSDGTLRIVAVDGAGDDTVLQPVRDIALQSTLEPGEKVTSVMPDWTGRYWYVGARGTVGVVQPDGTRPRAAHLGGESIENSFAVTRDGVYVATGAAVYRLWAGLAAPQVIWREPYDAGLTRKPGQTSRASGTTPTVFAGGAFVAITDNAEPRMNVVVLRTAVGATQRTACRVPVFGPGQSATENSLVAIGSSLFVENNYGYAPPLTSTMAGATTVPGLARVDVGPGGRCTLAWSNSSLSVPSVVSKGSAGGGVIYTYSKPPSWWGGDGWYFTAVDLRDGQVLWTRLAGGGLGFNNHYAGVALSPRGDLMVGTVYGLAVLRAGAS